MWSVPQRVISACCSGPLAACSEANEAACNPFAYGGLSHRQLGDLTMLAFRQNPCSPPRNRQRCRVDGEAAEPLRYDALEPPYPPGAVRLAILPVVPDGEQRELIEDATAAVHAALPKGEAAHSKFSLSFCIHRLQKLPLRLARSSRAAIVAPCSNRGLSPSRAGPSGLRMMPLILAGFGIWNRRVPHAGRRPIFGVCGTCCACSLLPPATLRRRRRLCVVHQRAGALAHHAVPHRSARRRTAGRLCGRRRRQDKPRRTGGEPKFDTNIRCQLLPLAWMLGRFRSWDGGARRSLNSSPASGQFS